MRRFTRKEVFYCAEKNRRANMQAAMVPRLGSKQKHRLRMNGRCKMGLTRVATLHAIGLAIKSSNVVVLIYSMEVLPNIQA